MDPSSDIEEIMEIDDEEEEDLSGKPSSSSATPEDLVLWRNKRIEEIDVEIQQLDSEVECLYSKRRRLVEEKKRLESETQREQLKKGATANVEEWETEDFPWSSKLLTTLKRTFKLDKFRPLQVATINAVLSKKNVILIMPTGGGKSLCYQLPALLLKGITLVITPLVSLMEDQVMSLGRLGVNARFLCASTPKDEIKEIQNGLATNAMGIKLLYVTPERLAKSKVFMTKLQKCYEAGNLSQFAVDEVHCCSSWGHDFRPDYKFLNILRGLFPKTPILGLTATATGDVVKDSAKILNISDAIIFRSSFNRHNLFYQVLQKPSTSKDVVSLIFRLLSRDFQGQCGIIYTLTIKDSEEVASELRVMGVKAQAYHAQMSPQDRTETHNDWIQNKLQVVVATIAFGMGIDKPDVRFVIHHTVSKSIENFYQESGRAGRDDERASCIVLWRLADLFRVTTMVFTERTGLQKAYDMAKYCLDHNSCRRAQIAPYFDEAWDPEGGLSCNGMCDHCADSAAHRAAKIREVDVSGHCKAIYDVLKSAAQRKERMTAVKVIDALQSKGNPKMSRELAEFVVGNLIIKGYLKEDFHFTPYNTISYLLPGPEKASFLRSPSLKLAVAESMLKSNGKPASSATKVGIQSRWMSLESTSQGKAKTTVLKVKRGTTSSQMPFDEPEDWDEAKDTGVATSSTEGASTGSVKKKPPVVPPGASPLNPRSYLTSYAKEPDESEPDRSEPDEREAQQEKKATRQSSRRRTHAPTDAGVQEATPSKKKRGRT